ncbi:cupin domain-containing protein [Streptomyces sp. NPDC015130]|uniref:cupin domain-containing protein n=1 Tax=Streptomyces sp. NPDC015130 TaxID=3364940 RepID=UPI003702C3E6
MDTVGTARDQRHAHQDRGAEHEDLLSELLKPLRLTGVFASRWNVRAPWAVEGDAERSCAVLHYVVEGDCWITAAGEPSVELHTGDLVVFPTGTAHRLADRPERRGVPLKAVLPERRPGTSGEIVIDGTGPTARLLCAGLHYDAGAATALSTSLPWALVLDRGQVDREPLLRDTLRLLATPDRPAGPATGSSPCAPSRWRSSSRSARCCANSPAAPPHCPCFGTPASAGPS